MAERLLNHWSKGRFNAYSAGSHPRGDVHPLALATLRRTHLATDNLRSKSWDEFATPDAPPLDFVFTVCDRAAQEMCPFWPGQPMTAHWGVADPAAVEGTDAAKEKGFQTAFRELAARVGIFTSLRLDAIDQLSLQRQLNEIGHTGARLRSTRRSSHSKPVTEREAVVRRGKRLEHFTIAWNSLEGLIAVAAGAVAGSSSLVGFGIDSFIEVTSGSALLWRIARDHDLHRREQREQVSLRVVSVCFLALAAYIAFESLRNIVTRNAPAHSLPGILLACASLIVMPMLSRAKRRVGTALKSAAMHADAKQTEFCTYLSAILLGGLLLNTLWGWWWADPAAGLLMVPIVANEGVQGLRGHRCCE